MTAGEAAAWGEVFVTADGVRLPLPGEFSAAAGRDLVFGLRPEFVRLDPSGIEVPVVLIEPTGSETHIVARLGGAELTCVFRERVAARPGDRIHLSIDAARVHLFDGETGQRPTR